ncbi:MAG: PAM68 family protein [Oscillatoriales cyanobacterium C42_A2020_001]|nr:PAM68 family protein [Leptolyngbyaceae cyanobacterium C42_A2020_001]
MSSKSQPPKNAEQDDGKGFSKEVGADKSRLPFEPTQNKKKTPKKPAQTSEKKSAKAEKANAIRQRAFTGVPEVVSKRMARRMAFFCGIPTSLGMLTFIVSYFIVSQHIFKLPTVFVLLTSLGFFGLGVLGLSYGALSASWDEGRVGSWFGWGEFRTNWGRAIESWKDAR